MTRVSPQDLHVAVIGAGGNQASEFIDLRGSGTSSLVAVEIDEGARRRVSRLGHRTYASTDELLKDELIDAAYIAVPHHHHAPLAAQLLQHGVTVLEEKPFAVTNDEANALIALSASTGTPVFTTAQRPFKHTFRQLLSSLHVLGDIYSYTYDYTLSLASQTTGWRSSWTAARGGVMLDMAYHQLDVITLLLGPQKVEAAQVGYCYRESWVERLEDAGTILTATGDGRCTGRITTHRHAHAKSEQLVLYGSDAVAVMDARQLRIYDRKGSVRWLVNEPGGAQSAVRAMFQEYLANRRSPIYWRPHMERHRSVVECLDRAYEFASLERDYQEVHNA